MRQNIIPHLAKVAKTTKGKYFLIKSGWNFSEVEGNVNISSLILEIHEVAATIDFDRKGYATIGKT